MGLVQIHDTGPYTLADLDALPDDGRRRELVDGQLIVTPAPGPLHQLVSGNLYLMLRAARPAGLQAFYAPFDYRPSEERSFRPDLLVCRVEDVGPRGVERPLQLAVEIISPSTRMTDQLLKRGLYEQAGVASYWLIDPEQERLTVLELVDGSYVERAVVKGDDEFVAEVPFAVRVVPSELVSR